MDYKHKQLQGAWITTITPMNENGEILERLMLDLYNQAYKEGITGIIPLSPFGEGPLLDYPEKIKILRTLGEAGGSMKIYPAICESSYKTAIKLVHVAESAGADGIVLYPATYYKPINTDGIIAFLTKIFNETSLPIFLVNEDPFQKITLSPRIIRKFIHFSHFYGILDYSKDLNDLQKIRKEFQEILIFSGYDDMHRLWMEHGANGMVSLIGNIFPKLINLLYNYIKINDYANVEQLQNKISILSDLLNHYPTHHSLKYALYQRGYPNMSVRKPLAALTEDQKSRLKTDLKKFIAVQLEKYLACKEDFLGKIN